MEQYYFFGVELHFDALNLYKIKNPIRSINIMLLSFECLAYFLIHRKHGND
jgi:hypothetical protein